MFADDLEQARLLAVGGIQNAPGREIEQVVRTAIDHGISASSIPLTGPGCCPWCPGCGEWTT